jgi:hypothetical protein
VASKVLLPAPFLPVTPICSPAMKHLAGLSLLFSSDAGHLPCERACTQLMTIQKRDGSGQHFIVLVHGAPPPDSAFEQDVQHGKAVQQTCWSQITQSPLSSPMTVS